jgi:transcription termination/antitermination protein NusG
MGMDDELQEWRRRRKHQVFRLGDTVRVVYGPFGSFTGKIEGINQAKSLLKIKVAIFGRDKPLKLNFRAVEKLSDH